MPNHVEPDNGRLITKQTLKRKNAVLVLFWEKLSMMQEMSSVDIKYEKCVIELSLK